MKRAESDALNDLRTLMAEGGAEIAGAAPWPFIGLLSESGYYLVIGGDAGISPLRCTGAGATKRFEATTYLEQEDPYKRPIAEVVDELEFASHAGKRLVERYLADRDAPAAERQLRESIVEAPAVVRASPPDQLPMDEDGAFYIAISRGLDARDTLVLPCDYSASAGYTYKALSVVSRADNILTRPASVRAHLMQFDGQAVSAYQRAASSRGGEQELRTAVANGDARFRRRIGAEPPTDADFVLDLQRAGISLPVIWHKDGTKAKPLEVIAPPGFGREGGTRFRRRVQRRATRVVLSTVLVALLATAFLLGEKTQPHGKSAATVANPLPNFGSPHGAGISHHQYPSGYSPNGHAYPTFDSYIDYSDGKPQDQRAFLGARIVAPVQYPDGFETQQALRVRPGDEVLVSAYVNNNGPFLANRDGQGPAVAHNTRVAFNFPGQSKQTLDIGGFIRSDNARPVLTDASLRSISANLELRSETGQPIRLQYLPGSARLLQAHNGQADPTPPRYQVFMLSGAQQHMLFNAGYYGTGRSAELNPSSGVPVGSDGRYQVDTSLGSRSTDRLDFFAGVEYYSYVQFRARILSATPGVRAAKRRLPPVSLDMTSAARLTAGRGSPTNFNGSISAESGNVVQVGALASNTDAPASRRSSEATSLLIRIPKRPGSQIPVVSKVIASNEEPHRPYHTADTVTIRSRSGRPISLGHLSHVYIQRNTIPLAPDVARFRFGPVMAVPDRYVQVLETPLEYELRVAVPPDGRVRAGYGRAVRILFQAYVSG